MRCSLSILLGLLLGSCASTGQDSWVHEPYGEPQWIGSRHRTLPTFGNHLRRGTGYGGLELGAGIRSLPERTFGRVRHQGALGIQYLVPLGEGPVAVELGGFYSHDDNGRDNSFSTRDARTFEASIGARLSLNAKHGSLVPYVGCGVSSFYVRLDDDDVNVLATDTATGFYAKVGIGVYVGGNEYFSVEWRGVEETELSLLNENDSLDYHQVMVVFGYSW